MRLRPILPLALLALTTACIPRAPEPAPAPPAPPAPLPTPTPTPPPPPPFVGNWIDAPQTPGDWTYANGAAWFGASPATAQLTLRCDRSAGAVDIIRAGAPAPGAAMIVRTETVDRSVATQPAQAGASETIARMPARDPLLDAMAFSRGRFAIEVAGLPSLYIPSYPEVTRVIEDCR